MIPCIDKLMARRRKRSKWIKGPLNDWIIPYKYNWWFQFANVLLIVFCLCIVVFWITKYPPALVVAFFSIITLVPIFGMTEFGRGTVQGYRRARQIIEREGAFEERLQKKFGKKLYCYRAGARAASIEYDLSQKLIPVLANKWWPI